MTIQNNNLSLINEIMATEIADYVGKPSNREEDAGYNLFKALPKTKEMDNAKLNFTKRRIVKMGKELRKSRHRDRELKKTRKVYNKHFPSKGKDKEMVRTCKALSTVDPSLKGVEDSYTSVISKIEKRKLLHKMALIAAIALMSVVLVGVAAIGITGIVFTALSGLPLGFILLIILGEVVFTLGVGLLTGVPSGHLINHLACKGMLWEEDYKEDIISTLEAPALNLNREIRKLNDESLLKLADATFGKHQIGQLKITGDLANAQKKYVHNTIISKILREIERRGLDKRIEKQLKVKGCWDDVSAEEMDREMSNKEKRKRIKFFTENQINNFIENEFKNYLKYPENNFDENSVEIFIERSISKFKKTIIKRFKDETITEDEIETLTQKSIESFESREIISTKEKLIKMAKENENKKIETLIENSINNFIENEFKNYLKDPENNFDENSIKIFIGMAISHFKETAIKRFNEVEDKTITEGEIENLIKKSIERFENREIISTKEKLIKMAKENEIKKIKEKQIKDVNFENDNPHLPELIKKIEFKKRKIQKRDDFKDFFKTKYNTIESYNKIAKYVLENVKNDNNETINKNIESFLNELKKNVSENLKNKIEKNSENMHSYGCFNKLNNEIIDFINLSDEKRYTSKSEFIKEIKANTIKGLFVLLKKGVEFKEEEVKSLKKIRILYFLFNISKNPEKLIEYFEKIKEEDLVVSTKNMTQEQKIKSKEKESKNNKHLASILDKHNPAAKVQLDLKNAIFREMVTKIYFQAYQTAMDQKLPTQWMPKYNQFPLAFVQGVFNDIAYTHDLAQVEVASGNEKEDEEIALRQQAQMDQERAQADEELARMLQIQMDEEYARNIQ